MLLDGQLRHYDVVERHRLAAGASRDTTYRTLQTLDFAPALDRAVRAVLDMRDLPGAIRDVARRLQHRPPGTSWTIADVLAHGFVLLGERPDRAIILGAIGKLWKPEATLLPLTRAQFLAFHDPQYVKLAIAIWVEPVGRGKSAVRFEARAAATDDSARAHLRRWYRVFRPYTGFLIRRALAAITAEAETPRLPAPV